MDKKNRNFFHNSSIRYTIFTYFTVTALAASLLITFSIYQRLSSQVSQTVMEENQSLIGQVARSVESYLRTVMKLSDSLYYGAVKNADLSSESINSEITLLYDNNKDNVDNIALFSQDGALKEAVPAARIKTNLDVTGDSWFTNALEKTENQHFSNPHVQYIFDGNESQYRWVISLSRAVELTEGTSTDQGVLLVDLSYSSLAHLFDGVTTGTGGYVYLISSDGEILYHPKIQLIDSGRVAENNLAAAGYKDGNHLEKFGGRERIITVKSIGYTGWKVVGVTPKNVVSLNTIKTRLFIVFIITLILFILTLINSYISSRITNPIKELEKSVGILEAGNLDAPVYIGGSYEIQHLGTSIGSMAKQIRVLMNDIVTEHEAKRKQEFDTLQSQINPHFLVNSLNSIRFIAQMSKYESIARMAEALIKILSCSFRSNGGFYTLKEELEVLDGFIYLMKIRYSDGFEIEYSIQQSCLTCLVPRLILQPVVENSIVHGFSDMMEEMGKISLIVQEKEGFLFVEIVDNGKGMTKEELDGLLSGREEMKEGKDHVSVGITNVRTRLVLNYGLDCGFEMESQPGRFTRTVIRLPIRREEAERP